jgi:ribonuclease HII
MGISDSTGPDFSLERAFMAAGVTRVAGVDEAGRGPWAGPVVAAAVILDPNNIPAGLDDSKKLTARKREFLFDEITRSSTVAFALCSPSEIDRKNILRASLEAMAEAVAKLIPGPDGILVDGNQSPPGSTPCKTIIGGDGRSLSIAAASIIAKVTRDRIMQRLAVEHPGYGWETNMGYGTKAHQIGLSKRGVTPHHRRSFKPIRDLLERA